MTDITVKIPDDLDDKFRKAVFHKFGMKRGVLKKAFVEAVKEWTAKNKPKKEED